MQDYRSEQREKRVSECIQNGNRSSTASFVSRGGAKEFAQKHNENEEKTAISEGSVLGSAFNSGSG